MILSLVAVGEEYIKNCKPFIQKFMVFGWDVHVLTDQPEEFECNTEKYQNKIFSYFDKLLFTLRLGERYKQDVLFIDADWIHNISDNLPKYLEKSDHFMYYVSWPNGETFDDYIDDPYFINLIRYWDKNNFDYHNLPTIMEWIFFMPYTNKISNLLYDIEHIKPIFEYNSVTVDTGYKGIGNGEGLALSYVLSKHKIPIKKFNNI